MRGTQWSDTGDLELQGGAIFSNLPGATFEVQGIGNLLGDNTLPTFSNAGMYHQAAGSSTHVRDLLFANAGTVAIDAGSAVSSDSEYRQTTGSTLLTGGALAATGGINIQGGILAGYGDIDGDVWNAGQLFVGGIDSTGILTIHGDYTQDAAGSLNLKI